MFICLINILQLFQIKVTLVYMSLNLQTVYASSEGDVWLRLY